MNAKGLLAFIVSEECSIQNKLMNAKGLLAFIVSEECSIHETCKNQE